MHYRAYFGIAGAVYSETGLLETLFHRLSKRVVVLDV